MCQVADATRVVNGLRAKEELDHLSQIDKSVNRVEQMEERSEFRAAAGALDGPQPALQDPAGAEAAPARRPEQPAETTPLPVPEYTFVGFGSAIDAHSHCGSTRRPAMPRTPQQLAALLDAVHAQVKAGVMADEGPYSIVWLGGQWKQHGDNPVWEWDDETPVSADMEWQAQQPSAQVQSEEPYLAMDSRGMLLDAAMYTSYAVFCEGVPAGQGSGSAVVIHGRPYQVVMEKDAILGRAGAQSLLADARAAARGLGVQGVALCASSLLIAAGALVALRRRASAPRAASYGQIAGVAGEPAQSIV
mmetsp:Transcript_38310/g.110526  ORF Transcript_38310/g.110526 Transcript_38310/m.110526 type:complete len:304 (+) Transcript_38310:1-912(+)